MDTCDINNYLKNFITEEREQRFLEKIRNRTEYITVVLEDLFQKHNSSAVIRSCDCFGIQNVHIIENKNTFSTSRDVDMGSSKWLSIKQYNKTLNNTTSAINELKAQGYRIVATTPHHNDTLLDDFDINNGKIALLFGTELTGLSETALDLADEYLKIPMFGFTESLNISVSVAIILHFLTNKLHNSDIAWQLDKTSEKEVLYQWYKNSINESNKIIDKFLLKV